MESRDQILLQEIHRAFCDLDPELDKRPGQSWSEVCLGRCDETWNSILDRDDAANAIFERGEIALQVSVYVQGIHVGHWVALERGHVDKGEELVLDGCAQETQIDRGARAELARIEFLKAFVEAFQTRELRVNRGAAVVPELAVVFVKAKCDRFQGPRGEITGNVFFGQLVERRVVCSGLAQIETERLREGGLREIEESS